MSTFTILRRCTTAFIACFLVASFSGQALAIPFFEFTTPDQALPSPYPGFLGGGLNGNIWASVPFPASIPARTLAFSESYIASNPTPSGTFTSTQIDYPNGSANVSPVPGTSICTFLGTDCSSLSSPSLGSVDFHNSIIELNGYLAIPTAFTTYQFDLGSDDGSEVWIQGTSILKRDGIHAFTLGVNPVDVKFDAAGLYAIRLLYYEAEPTEGGLCMTHGPLDNCNIVVVPEPATIPLLGIGLYGLALTRRRRLMA